jgi:DUF2934 family protein
MAKRSSARSEVRDMATASNPPREAASSTAIDTERERTKEPSDSGVGSSGPNEEEIRHRAYLRYLERGGGDGQDFDDWLEAERELTTRKSEVRSQKSDSEV